MTESETRTERLAQWAANLQYQDLPEEVIQRTKELFIDWLGCTIAGRHHPAVAAIVRFATQMGPSSGKSEVIDGSLGLTSSPAFASLINGASSHVVEQDDLHNRSIMHPVCSFGSSLASNADDLGDGDISRCAGRRTGPQRRRQRVHHWLRSRVRSWLPDGRISGKEPLRGILSLSGCM
jgi:2-methylcitrate dehydratase PrpD